MQKPYKTVAKFKAVPLSKDSYHIFVNVVVNATKAIFIIDTGASGTVIDQGFYLKKLASKQKKINQEVRGLNSVQYEMHVGVLKTLKIGKSEMKNVKVSSLSLDHVNEAYKKNNLKFRIQGILGSDILLKEGWLIDYKNLAIGSWE
jgi:hypothetical protein